MSLETVVMTPIHTNPSPRSSPQSVPPAPPSRPDCDYPKKADVLASASASLVERPYAPVLPPATSPHERETVEALVGLASTSQQSPTTAAVTSFSAINVATTSNGTHDGSMRTSSEHANSSNKSFRAIHLNQYSPNTAQPVGLPKIIKSNDGSSSRARRRRRSNSPGIVSPRGHRKPYDGHILKKDTVVGETAQPPRASSPRNYPQVPQQDSHSVPHQIESKPHSQRQRQHWPPQYKSLSPRPQQALPRHSQQPTIHYANQTIEPRMANIQPPRTYSAEVHGFTLLRGTIPIETAQKASDVLNRGMTTARKEDTFKVFGMFCEANTVRDEFLRNVSVHLSYLPSLEVMLRFFESSFAFYAVKSTAVVTSLPNLVLSYFYF